MEAPQVGAGNDSPDSDSDFAIRLLAAGKRCGLTFDEMRELRVRDLLDLIESYLGKSHDGKPRMATQADIDRLLA